MINRDSRRSIINSQCKKMRRNRTNDKRKFFIFYAYDAIDRRAMREERCARNLLFFSCNLDYGYCRWVGQVLRKTRFIRSKSTRAFCWRLHWILLRFFHFFLSTDEGKAESLKKNFVFVYERRALDWACVCKSLPLASWMNWVGILCNFDSKFSFELIEYLQRNRI